MDKATFQLDARIPEEAALLDYLDRFPVNRHPEQIRRLALIGYQQMTISNDQAPNRREAKERQDPVISRDPEESSTASERPVAPKSSPAPTLASLKAVVG